MWKPINLKWFGKFQKSIRAAGGGERLPIILETDQDLVEISQPHREDLQYGPCLTGFDALTFSRQEAPNNPPARLPTIFATYAVKQSDGTDIDIIETTQGIEKTLAWLLT